MTDTDSATGALQGNRRAMRSTVGWMGAVLFMFLLLVVALFGTQWSRYAIIAPLVAVYLIIMIRVAKRPD